MNIHQLLTFYSYGDAIGNEAYEIKRYLTEKGHNSQIFAFRYHPKYADQVIHYDQYHRFSSPQDIVIFHFSIGSPVTQKFLSIPHKKVIIYHNITPHQYFLDYQPVLAIDCYKGREELKQLVGNVALALGDSQYNESELKAVGFSPTGVLPLVMNFDKFNKEPLPVFKELFLDGKTNILYVGRIIPNKKIEDIIKAFHIYQSCFNPNSRLLLVGEFRAFERYLVVLRDLVNRLNVKNVHFTGHTPEDELISYFKIAHLYLHMSEHEGFCAPIPESFYLNIPVIAFDACAVKETMNGGGILVHQKDFVHIAALIARILEDPSLKSKILESQQKALQKYTLNRTGSILMEYLSRI